MQQPPIALTDPRLYVCVCAGNCVAVCVIRRPFLPRPRCPSAHTQQNQFLLVTQQRRQQRRRSPLTPATTH